MKYEIHSFARRNFSHLTNQRIRTHAAEARLVEMFFDGEEAGYFVEVGANDPIRSSQTWHLEQQGWSGVLIEPIPELCDRLREQRPKSLVVQAACGPPGHQETAHLHVSPGFSQSTLKRDRLSYVTAVERVETVRMVTLDEVLESAKLPRLDFVSIDVEGFQYEVLRGFTLSLHKPRLLVVEDHLSDLKTHRLLIRNGYRLAKRAVRNNWYIPRDHDFSLTSLMERFLLWKKLYLHTPVRKVRFAARRKIQRWSLRRKAAK